MSWEKLIRFFVENKLVVWVLLALLLVTGLSAEPFELGIDVERDPVPVDAIPDIGENQQIVFTKWDGRSPRDIEDQVTYPLTTALLGIPGVKTVRSFSMFGFSSIYVIFEDDVEFYWSRSRILEKLNSLPAGLLPDAVQPALGPDATALGQIFWYSLEGKDKDGNTVGGWDLHELRNIQDWTVRYALQSVSGVSEVASVGGFSQEYQIDLDPDALRAHNVTLAQVLSAVRQSNLDVGARTMEINQIEYIIRGVGFLEDVKDLEDTVVAAREFTPIRIADVARVTLGPANRRGAIDLGGAEIVGGIVTARYGSNPQATIDNVKAKIEEISPGLPKRVLEDGTVSQVTVVPFYDRSSLIQETLGTLSEALWLQILVTIIVVLLMLRHLRSSALITGLLPLAVLGSFVAMREFGIDANIMSLAGIAIAIGTMVDMGIVVSENIVQKLGEADDDPLSRREAVIAGASEVAPAVFTSTMTTVVSFLPVFGLTASEGKLFTPLAYTKTFALLASLLLATILLPVLASLHLPQSWTSRLPKIPELKSKAWIPALVVALIATWMLGSDWQLLVGSSNLVNFLVTAFLFGGLLGIYAVFQHYYLRMLSWVLQNRVLFAVLPLSLVLVGTTAWLGFDRVFSWLPQSVRMQPAVVDVAHSFPGFGREFMPAFDEGQFLYMPTTMPHASFGEALDQLQEMDKAIQAIPEVKEAVGKLGRADTALDPAPVSMFETVITYIPEYRTEPDGTRVRQWRDHIRTPDDIWNEVVAAAQRPGLTSAPKLMPINTRIVMLQSGMRAPLGIKVRGPDLESIEATSLAIEELIKQVSAIRSETVFAERIVGKPYLEIEIDREAIGRYGLTVAQVQQVLQYAVGGQALTRTVEGRERHPVRVRYMREERDTVEALRRVPVPTPGGEQIPLEQLARIEYVRGPQVIKSEDTFMTGYVIFDRASGIAEIEAVEITKDFLDAKVASGELVLPDGVSYTFAGTYQNQIRSEKRLSVLVPLALALILLILYLQFRRTAVTGVIFSGVAVAISGGFMMLWLYGQPWFMDFSLFGVHMRELFNIAPTNMSVAVWVGFIALVGIATDDGVVMATYLKQTFDKRQPESEAETHAAILHAAGRRIRPCLMTTATTLLALLPVITSTGRGSDIMIPMAIPIVGGMAVELVTLFVVPLLWSTASPRP